jgi:hypothetical protein
VIQAPQSLSSAERQFLESLSPSELDALEMATRRDLAKQILIAFTEWTFQRYRPAPPHRLIAEQLERVERGEVDRLMLLVPPRHGKSELASRRFPAFYLGKHPERQFISASASGPLAEDFGREVRNIVASEEYVQLFDTRLAEDSQARGRWNTKQGGSYYAVGIGGALMGRGAHVALIDDPFANMADARSEAGRKAVWDWYTGTLYNRLEDGGAIVLINHRMHEDDLSGMLLAQQAAGGDAWEVVRMPAIEDGGALWPEKYPVPALERIKRNIKATDWSALYQQNPTPDEGTYFLDEWFRPYVEAPDPKTLSVYGGSDYAVTADGGDYTVHAVIGVDPEDRMYLLDIWRKQAASNEWVEAWCANGSRNSGPKSWCRSRPVSGRFSSSARRSARRTRRASSSRCAATRASGRSRSAAAWRRRGSTCRRMRAGGLTRGLN